MVVKFSHQLRRKICFTFHVFGRVSFPPSTLLLILSQLINWIDSIFIICVRTWLSLRRIPKFTVC